MLSSKRALTPSSVIGFLPNGTSVVLAMPVSSFWRRARLGSSKCFAHPGVLAISFPPSFSYSLYSHDCMFYYHSFHQYRPAGIFLSSFSPLQFNSNSSLFEHCFFARKREFPAVCCCCDFTSVPTAPAARILPRSSRELSQCMNGSKTYIHLSTITSHLATQTCCD